MFGSFGGRDPINGNFNHSNPLKSRLGTKTRHLSNNRKWAKAASGFRFFGFSYLAGISLFRVNFFDFLGGGKILNRNCNHSDPQKALLWTKPRLMSGNRIWAKAASDLGASGREKKGGNISHKTLTNRTPVGAPLLNRPSNLLSRCVVLHDVITHAKFGFDRFTGFCATGCQSFYICIWKPYGPYNRLCTIVQDCDTLKMHIVVICHPHVAAPLHIRSEPNLTDL